MQADFQYCVRSSFASLLSFSTKSNVRVSLIDAHLSSMNYDANKLPLGKLSKNTILQGFSALKQLADVIKDPNGEVAKANGGQRAAIEHLSGVYYS